MLYRNEPWSLATEDLLCAQLVASEVASMGTWDWDINADTVRWSDNLERIHGLPPGTFDGTFDSDAREIHPDDRERVMAAVGRR